MASTCKNASYPPPKPTLSSNVIINENFELPNPLNGFTHICKLCEKKQIFFNFNLHYDDTYVCKKCCKNYNIKYKEDLQTVQTIRKNIKDNMTLEKIDFSKFV